jgi:transposase
VTSSSWTISARTRYSPDLNPIEQVFAKLKHLLRKARARTIEATWRHIGTLIERFSPIECATPDTLQHEANRH